MRHPIIGQFADNQTAFARTYPHPIWTEREPLVGGKVSLVLICVIVFAFAAVAAVYFAR